MLLKIVMFLAIVSSVNCNCTFDTSIDISHGLRFPNGTIESGGILYAPGKHITYNNTVRGCICKIKHCYRKCCARNHIYDDTSKNCIDVMNANLTDDENESIKQIFSEFKSLEQSHGLIQVNGYNDLNGCGNTSCLFSTDSYRSHHISEVGDLVVDNTEGLHFKVDVDRYCIDVSKYFDDRTQSTKVGREAFFIGQIMQNKETNQLNYIATLISIVFIILTLTVYTLIPALRQNNHGRILIAYQFSMLATFVLLASLQTIQFYGVLTRRVCMYFSFLIYFFLLATSFWMNVITWDMWKKTRGEPLTERKGGSIKTFLKCCLYAFGVPAALTVLLAVLEFAPIEDNKYLPRMRKRECFLSGLGKIIYLHTPITVICVINTMVFILIAYNIIKTRFSKYCVFCVLLKIFILMGLGWIFEGTSYLFPEAKTLWMITDVFNALSGFLIFIIVVCNKEVLGEIIRRCFRRRNDKHPMPDSSLKVLRRIESLSYLY